jgi:hypothetical protein
LTAYDEIKRSNFEDLYKFYYVEPGAARAAEIIHGVREDLLSEGLLRSFPSAEGIKDASAILFSPLGDLLKFYSLMEIALLIKFIPEPDYASEFWTRTRRVLSFKLMTPYMQEDYPLQLPRFLLGRLEGRMHLAEEFSKDRYDQVCAMFLSFLSQVSRWRDADIQVFLRFVLSSDTDEAQFDRFRSLIIDRDEFMSRILTTRIIRQNFDDQLLHGLSKILSLCEDMDRLLGEMDDFPLLQSAMSNYYSDLLGAMNQRLRNYILELVQSFSEWTKIEEKEDEDRTRAISEYIAEVKQFLDRLSTAAASKLESRAPVTA